MDLFFTDKYGHQLIEGDKVLVTYMGTQFEAEAVSMIDFDWVLCKIPDFEDEKPVERKDVLSVESLKVLESMKLQEAA